MDMGKIIRRAIRNQKKKGVQIVANDFGIEGRYNIVTKKWKYSTRNGFCCPLGAVMLEYGPKRTKFFWHTVAALSKKYGRDFRWIHSFIEGVDGGKCHKEHHKRAFNLGKSIRKEFQVWR